MEPEGLTMNPGSFVAFFQHLWGSALPVQLMRAILVAALFEGLVWAVHRWLRKALTPALARDAQADQIQRLERRRIVLGLPLTLTRSVLYLLAVLIILRIFRFNANLDLYPLALGVLLLVLVAARDALRDAVAGYFISLDYLYAVGDEITVGDVGGMVSEISLRTTKLRTRDGQEVVLRNSLVRQLINHTGPRRRSGDRPA
jgi:small-conductance mechanosensitive channel